METELYKRIKNDMLLSMKQRSERGLELEVLRMLVSEIKNRKIDKKDELTDDEIISCIKKAIKGREDAASMYEDAGRAELAKKEKQEVGILEVYLPAKISQEKLANLVDTAISEYKKENAILDMKSFGLIMKAVMAKAKEDNSGMIDGGELSSMIKEKISTVLRLS